MDSMRCWTRMDDNMPLARSGLTDAQWVMYEKLMACDKQAVELPELDHHEFHSAILSLQNQVLALPARRALLKEKESK